VTTICMPAIVPLCGSWPTCVSYTLALCWCFSPAQCRILYEATFSVGSTPLHFDVHASAHLSIMNVFPLATYLFGCRFRRLLDFFAVLSDATYVSRTAWISCLKLFLFNDGFDSSFACWRRPPCDVSCCARTLFLRQ
jgi:hypothetical protein